MIAQALVDPYGVTCVCMALGLARSSYYYTPVLPSSDTALGQVLSNLAAQYPTYGYRRLTYLVRQRSGFERTNKKRVQRVMQTLGLQAQKTRHFRATTDSQHSFPRYPNLVQDLAVVRPDQVWVCDLTRVVLADDEVVYLAIILDVFTRAIRGWALERDLSQHLTLTALQRALRQHTPEIHHSDQGVQYAATVYTQRLEHAGIAISMAEVGCAWQNGFAERVIRTIKEEEIRLNEYRSFAEAHRQIGRFIEHVYNRKRIHSALGYLTPAQYEAQWQAQRAA